MEKGRAFLTPLRQTERREKNGRKKRTDRGGKEEEGKG